MIKNKIQSLLRNILKKEFSISNINFTVEHPADEKHGDYSTNIAMAIFANSKFKILASRRSGQNAKFRTPMELAKRIASSVQRLAPSYIEKIEVAKPGFINFYLAKEYLVNDLLKPQSFKQTLRSKKIMIEFTDPNPFKEFHIGHLYSNTVGEAISRMLTALGANLKRANYQGDVGMHIAKSLYAILQISNLKSQISNLENKSAKERAEFLGQYYVVGAKAYEVSEKAKKEIEELNKKIYNKDPAIMGLYEKGRQWSLEYFETIYKRLGTKFDFYYFESEVGIDGLKLVKEYLKKGIFEESQGAVIFPGKKHGLHDRVFINSLGLPTYEAKDLGLAFKKYRDFKFDQSISVTGSEIIGYFKVILSALQQIDPELAGKIKHIPHGMVRLPTGKMSSRTGNIVTGEWFLDEAKKLLKSKYSEMIEATLEKVAVGSVKYALLKSSLGHDIEFNFKESINLQGNSGPYLQYVYARTQSVILKAISNQKKETSSKNEISFARRSFARRPLAKLELEEISLLRALNKFTEVVSQAGANFAPNLLCNYLFDLAQKFNLFYQRHRIIGAVREIGDFRLALTQGVGRIIKTGLNLLGISAPEKM